MVGNCYLPNRRMGACKLNSYSFISCSLSVDLPNLITFYHFIIAALQNSVNLLSDGRLP